MEKYIAIVKQTDNKVTKYQDCAVKLDADFHVITHGGFVAEKPSDRIKYWVVDADKKTLTYDKSTADSDDAALAAVAYKGVRRAAYPEVGDQLDEIYHNGIDGWKSTIKVVKDKYPKP